MGLLDVQSAMRLRRALLVLLVVALELTSQSTPCQAAASSNQQQELTQSGKWHDLIFRGLWSVSSSVGKVIDETKDDFKQNLVTLKRLVAMGRQQYDHPVFRRTAREFVHKLKEARLQGHKWRKHAVFLFPSFLGSSMYLAQEPNKYLRTKCKLRVKHSRVWLSARFATQSILHKAVESWGKDLRKCYGRVLSMQPHVVDRPQAGQPPVDYTEEFKIGPRWGIVEEAKFLLGPIMGSLTDAGDAFDEVIDNLRLLGFRDDKDLFTVQYDWRMCMDIACKPFQRYARKVMDAMERVPNDQPIMLVGYSLGSVVINELLRYILKHKPQLLSRIHQTSHIGGADGGAPEGIGTVLVPLDTIKRLFGEPEVGMKAVRSWPVFAWVVPGPKVTGKVVRVTDSSTGHTEYYTAAQLPDLLTKYFPQDPDMTALARMIRWRSQRWAERVADVEAAYRKIKSSSCIDSTGIPSIQQLRLRVVRRGGKLRLVEEKSLLTHNGDGCVVAPTLGMCRRFAAHTELRSTSMTLRPTSADWRLAGKGSEKSDFVVAKNLPMEHGSIGRFEPRVLQLLLAQAVGLPDTAKDLPVVQVPRVSSSSSSSSSKPSFGQKVNSILKSQMGHDRKRQQQRTSK